MVEPASGTVIGGKYRLERPLARGGMGAVWAGRHTDLDVPIAIKFMEVEPSSGSVTPRARFEREAKAAASLRSPHVVQVIDYDATGEKPYIVMELLEGEDLGSRLRKRGRLELSEVAAIVSQLAKGLDLAHRAGIVHRDLKPGNVFLATVGAEEIVKVLDFGVAKETRLDQSDTQTTTGLVVGSPSYMSPEQARGGRVDQRSDLWALGVLVFQALTGKRPFEGANVGDVLVRICSDPIPIATVVAPDLPPAVDVFFERALCRSPDGRYQDAAAFARALADLAASSGSGVAPRAGERAEETGVAPRVDETGSVVARSEPTGAATIVDRARLEPAPPSAPPRDEPRTDASVPQETRFTAAARIDAKRSDRRGLWGLGGAAAVAAVWLATQLAGAPGADPATGRAAPGPATSGDAAASGSAAPASTAPVVTAADATAIPSAAAPPGAASASVASSAASPPAPPSLGPRPVPRPRPPGPAPVDPKFGLPAGGG